MNFLNTVMLAVLMWLVVELHWKVNIVCKQAGYACDQSSK